MEKPLTSVRRESMDLAGLLEEHGDHLLRLCTLYLGDRSQAEDAVQDTFLRALRAWPGFRGDCAVETWLVRIAINVCKRQLRSPWRLLRHRRRAWTACAWRDRNRRTTPWYGPYRPSRQNTGK